MGLLHIVVNVNVKYVKLCFGRRHFQWFSLLSSIFIFVLHIFSWQHWYLLRNVWGIFTLSLLNESQLLNIQEDDVRSLRFIIISDPNGFYIGKIQIKFRKVRRNSEEEVQLLECHLYIRKRKKPYQENFTSRYQWYHLASTTNLSLTQVLVAFD